MSQKASLKLVCITKCHSEKVTKVNIEKISPCNCRNKQDCSLGRTMSEETLYANVLIVQKM